MFPKDNKFVTHPISIIDQDPISGLFLLVYVSRHKVFPISASRHTSEREERTINDLGFFLFRVLRDNQGKCEQPKQRKGIY